MLLLAEFGLYRCEKAKFVGEAVAVDVCNVCPGPRSQPAKPWEAVLRNLHKEIVEGEKRTRVVVSGRFTKVLRADGEMKVQRIGKLNLAIDRRRGGKGYPWRHGCYRPAAPERLRPAASE